MKTPPPINNNILFYVFAAAGMFFCIVFLRLILVSFPIQAIGLRNLPGLLVAFLGPVFIGLLILAMPRLYVVDKALVVKKSFKVDRQIPLKEIRVINRIAAFPFGFAYSNMICRYNIDYLDDNNRWRSVQFFDTVSDQKNIHEFIEAVKQENPFLKSAV